MAGRGRGRASTLPAWMTKSDGGNLSSPTQRATSPSTPPTGSHGSSRGRAPPSSIPSPRKGQFDDAPEPPRRGGGDDSINGRRSHERPNGGGGGSDRGGGPAYNKRSQSPARPPSQQQSWRGGSKERSRSRDRQAPPPRSRDFSRDREPPPRDDWNRRSPGPSGGYNNGYDRRAEYLPREDRGRRSRSRDRGYGGSRNGGGGGDYRSDPRYADRDYSSQGSSNGGGGGGDRYESYFRGGGGSDYRGGGSRDYEYRGGGDRRERSPPSVRRDDYYDRGYGRVAGSLSSSGGHDDRTSRNYSDYRR